MNLKDKNDLNNVLRDAAVRILKGKVPENEFYLAESIGDEPPFDDPFFGVAIKEIRDAIKKKRDEKQDICPK